ncbi:unnamed protein product [Phytophthora lilii]|uniref:Unnamed protein product n=1 Tax=Phytophthora lilii TaxID=2077276 RepID=A0A9W6X3I1_9STRA|nr:unnamed protein product [Phytophthora lilii]
MERHNDAAELTQELQKLLEQEGDAAAKLQYANRQTNELSANGKTLAELVALLNEMFFRDIVPALKRAKHVAAGPTATRRGQQDPLDQYLEQGDDGTAMPQAFVDDMSGWAAPAAQEAYRSRKKTKNTRERSYNLRTSGQEDTGSVTSEDSDDGMAPETIHDMLIANSLKLTAMQASGYSASARQQQAAATQGANAEAQTDATSAVDASPRPSRSKANVKTRKRARVVPPPIVTDLPPRSGESTPRTQSRSPQEQSKKDRIGKRAAADLVAEQVLGVRNYGTVKEYFIRWQGVDAPLWIARRKASEQAKTLISMYSEELRNRNYAVAQRGDIDQARGNKQGKGKAARTGTSLRQEKQQAAGKSAPAPAEFYTVDHIVKHRKVGGKKQYLVRWESYDESEDTWEDAARLRADVPAIVDAYEKENKRVEARTEAVQSAISELSRDCDSVARKRSSSEGATARGKTHLSTNTTDANGEHGKEKRRRVSLSGAENKKEVDDEKDDYQFEMEEAELEEYSEDEFADKLNN